MSKRDSLWSVSVAMTADLRAALMRLQTCHEGKLRYVYEHAVRHFLARRQRGCVSYYPTRKNSKQYTVWMDRPLCDAMKQVADQDDVTLSLCLMTAFIDYCNAQGAFHA